MHTCCVESFRDTRGRYNRVTSRKKLVVLNESNTELKSLDEKTMRGLCLETCMNSLVKIPPYSKLSFERKMFLPKTGVILL